jgi:hypothetical protein
VDTIKEYKEESSKDGGHSRKNEATLKTGQNKNCSFLEQMKTPQGPTGRQRASPRHRIKQRQLGLQLSLDTWALSKKIADIKHLYNELEFKIQRTLVKTEITRTRVKIMRHKFKTQLAEVRAQAKHGSCGRAGTSNDTVQPLESSTGQHGPLIAF